MATADRRTFAEPGPSSLRCRAGWPLFGIALASFALLTGCGGEDQAAKPQGGFAVAGDDEGAGATSGTEGKTEGPSGSSALQNRIDAGAAAPGNPNAGAVAPPPSLAMEEFEADPVPQNATAAELMQYLKTLNARQQELQQLARSLPQDEVVKHFVDLQRKRIEASALLLVAEDAEDPARQEAIDITLGSFNALGQLGQNVTTEYEAFLAKHAADRDPVISRYTRSMQVAAGLGKVAGAENPTQEQADAALAEVDKLLAEVEPNGPTLGILAGAVGDLASMDRLDLASALIAKLDAAYGGVQDPELQTQYKNALGGAKASLVSVALQKVAAEPNPSQEQVDAALAQLDQFLATSQPSAQMFQAVASTASILMQQNQTQLAAAVLQRLGDAYVKLEDPELKQRGEVALVQAKLTALDIAKLMAAVGAGEEEPANRLVEVARQLVAEATPPPIAYLGVLNQFAQNLEYVHKYQQSGALYSLIAETYGTSADAEVAKEAGDMAQAGLKRIGLIGTKLELQGQAVGGAPFDWESYRGKYVLVDFWATWCQPCLAEIPNVEANLRKYKDLGFDVVAVNLDDDLATVQQFLTANPLPWTTIVSDDPANMGFKSPMAVKCGVEAIPFVLLVDRDGVVLDIHVRGADLGKKLAEIFGDSAGAAPAGSSPAGTAPAGSSPTGTGAASPPVGGVPGLEAPGPATSPAGAPSTPAARPGGGLPDLQPLRSSAIENVFDDGVWFVSAPADDTAPAQEESEEEAPANDDELFLASPDLTLDELVDFLFDMEEKPRSVQALKGFDAGVIDACDRIWRNPDATVPQLRLAATTKLKRLHRAGTMGNAKADVELAAYVERLAENPDEGIASWVELVRLENEAVAGETLSADKLPELLTELKTYFERIAAEERHLRLASLTVRLINRIDDPTADEEGQKELAAKREEQYKSFGDLFAKSENKELSRYGKKLAKPPAAQESDLVGKPLELEGDLADGGSFDWASYRGKVVVVDFWATWCGPCRREMPHVKEAFDRMNADGFEVVGISLDEDQEALAEYLEENQIEWATLVGDGSMQLAERYGVRGIPTMMLVDRDGTVLMVGHQAQPLIDKAIELLAAK